MTEVRESETLSQEIADTKERGLGVTLFAPNAVVLSDGNSAPRPPSTMGRNGRRETSYRGWVFEYDPAEVGILAPTDFELPRRGDEKLVTCPMCGEPFHRKRSDQVYDSPRCRRKGARRGGSAVVTTDDERMRRCEASDCSESLTRRTRRARFCSDRCRKKAAYWRRSA